MPSTQSLVRIDNINIHDNTLLPGQNWTWGSKFHYQEWDQRSTYGHCPISNVRITIDGIGNQTMHDGSESKFPCTGFQTNDITDAWFTNAISNITDAHTRRLPTLAPSRRSVAALYDLRGRLVGGSANTSAGDARFASGVLLRVTKGNISMANILTK
jgi:hypothetical protein